MEEICRRIEQIRNQLDVAINLVPAREPWCLLDRIDRDLRQLKKDIGHPSAGLGAQLATPADNSTLGSAKASQRRLLKENIELRARLAVPAWQEEVRKALEFCATATASVTSGYIGIPTTLAFVQAKAKYALALMPPPAAESDIP